MAKQITVAHFVTEAQAETVLASIRPWLRHRPRIAQFQEQLEATVEPIWAIDCAAGHYRGVNMALRKLRLPTEGARNSLRAMEESSASPEMVNYTDLLKLYDVRAALLAIDELEHTLDRIPKAFSGEQKPAKGPAPRNWYSSFVRDLAEIAKKLGIEVTTQGDRERNPYATPFTRFVFAVEKLLPREAQADSLAACAKQLERAIKASAQEIAIEQASIEIIRLGDCKKIRRKATS
jgi:hypothetical protein